MSANHHVSAVGRRRRQPPFEFFWAGLEPFLESWRQRPSADELLFQAGRQTILLREPGRKLVPMFVISAADNFAIVTFIVFGVLVVLVAVFVVALAMTFSLCEGEAATGEKYC